MVVRLGAAVLLTGLAFATQSLAEIRIVESSYSLDLREGEGPVLLSSAGATDADIVLAQLPTIELPTPLSGLAQQATLELAPTADAILAQLATVEVPAPLADFAIEVADAGQFQPIERAGPDMSLPPLAVVVERAPFSIFAAREDVENFSWMAAGQIDSDDLTTGSLVQNSAFQRVLGDHANRGRPIAEIISPLTDDALRALELAAP